MLRYIAKPGTWFIGGSEVVLLTDCSPQLPIGIFQGQRISEGLPELHPVGEVYTDEEGCGFDEFEVTDE